MVGARDERDEPQESIEELRRQLSDREEYLAAIIEAEPECVKVVAPDGTVLEMNAAGLAMVEADRREQVVGKSAFKLVAPEHLDAFRHLHQEVLNGSPQVLEFEMIGLKGARRWLETRAVPLRRGGEVLHLAIARDITEARRTQEALRASEERFRLMTEASPFGVFLTDERGGCVYANPTIQKQSGLAADQLLGEGWSLAVHPEDRQRILNEWQRSAVGRSDCTLQFRFLREDGNIVWVRVRAAPLWDRDCFRGHVGLTEDVTEQRDLEEQLRQSQKMEAVGRLAGGVAHDFNNMLAVINGYSELLLNAAPEDPTNPLRIGLEEISRAGERASNLTRQLLAFSRRQLLEPQTLHLGALITDMERMLHRLIGEDVDLSVDIDPNLHPVRADAGQMQQIVLNLVVNSRDAMPEGGRLNIEARSVTVFQEDGARLQELLPGQYVLLTVCDTGIGMPADIRKHIFEPFFTTKPAGEGTGLGLSTVFGIVKQSGGHIECETEVGAGTTFRVYLPQAPEIATIEPPRQQTALSGDETLLLVEDEDMLRELVRTVLARHGYTVLVARDGTEALRLSAEHEGEIALLITDVVMPGGVGGRAVAEALSKTRPKTRVLYMSGYTDDAVVRHGVQEAATAFLQKPFTPVDLARKVRELLD
jgi:two-component system cell cycle sensor histidine kinase/response regulator CckA